MSDQALIDALNRNTEAMHALAVAQATMTERVGNLIEKVNTHLQDDEEIHEEHEGKIGALETWRTKLTTKIGTYAAIAAAVFTVLGGLAEKAVAAAVTAIIHQTGGTPPAP